MLYWLFLLITLPAVAGCGYLLILQYEQRERALRELDAEIAYRSERRHKLRPTDYYLKIALTDPLAVARRESVLGRFGSRLAPVLITKEVYKQLEKEISAQLDEREIVAEFSLHIARPPQAETSRRSASKSKPGKDAASQRLSTPRPLAGRDISAGVIIREESLLRLNEPEPEQSPAVRKRRFNPFRAFRDKKVASVRQLPYSPQDSDPYDDLMGRHERDQTVRENLDR